MVGPHYGVDLDEDVAAITEMDQVFTFSGTKHITLQHRFVRRRLDLLAVWHRVLHWPILNNEKATIAECRTTSDADGQRWLGSWLCENAKTHNRDRRSYSSNTALIV